MNILWIVLGALFGLLMLLLAVVLLVPVHVCTAIGDTQRRLSVSWLGISIENDWAARETAWRIWSWGPRTTRWKRAEPKGKPEAKKARRMKPKKERQGKSILLWLSESDLAPLVARVVVRFFGDLLRPLRLDYLDAEAVVATPDFALTGFLYGLSQSVVWPVSSTTSRIALKTVPDFSSETPSLTLRASLRYRLLGALGALWRAFWALPKRRIYRLVRRRRTGRMANRSRTYPAPGRNGELGEASTG